jgi:hypothetical protein
MPVIADISGIGRTLGSILPGGPVSHGALTVVPLLAPAQPDPSWLTLVEAGDRVRITEVDEAGAVPRLRVANLAGQPVLLLDGEELVGAKQNRVLNTTVLVPARSELTIPVSCVEQGRWAYRGRHFAPTDASLFASLRQKKAAWVTRSVRAGRGHAADQSGVWSALAAVAGQVGALVFLSGRWAGMDLLASAGLFGRAWPRLCAGYVADAIGRPPALYPTERPPSLLAALPGCPVEAAPAVGLGVEYRLTGERLAGAALVADGRVAHLMAFPVEGSAGTGRACY